MQRMNADEELLLRALVVADLITIHQKTPIGRLSAFCGAVSAGCGAAAGIAYLYGGRYDEVAHTIANTLAICSGMILTFLINLAANLVGRKLKKSK